MRLIESNLGPVVLGIFFNTYLYGIVTYQYSTYFNTRFRDPLWIKGTVVALFCLDTFHTSSLMYMAWYYTIASFGDLLALLAPVWPYPFSIFITVVTALLAHLFLAYRTLRLTNVYIYGTLILLSLSSFSGGMVCGVRTWISVRSPAAISIENPYLATWLSLEVVTDAAISGTLIYALQKSRPSFERSHTVINRLMRTSIQTGFFTGVFSILTLSFYLALPNTQIWAFFGLSIGRLYTNTLMDTLLCREGLRGILKQVETTVTTTNRSIRLTVQREVHTDFRSDRPMSFAPSQKMSSMDPIIEQGISND